MGLKIDCVFSGGGMKALAFIGAIEVLEEKNYEFVRAAGTSAGAITAALVSAGYKSSQLKSILDELDEKTILDKSLLDRLFPFPRWVAFYFRMGLYKGNKLEEWLESHLSAKGIHTFKDLPDGKLKVVASDLTSGNIIVMPDDLPKYGIEPGSFSVARAVRMSAGIPYYFIPEKIIEPTKDKHVIVDGGLLSSFPLWVFDKEEQRRKRPILGVKLSKTLYKPIEKKISNSFDMLQALFSTMLSAHDNLYINKSDAKNIIFLPVPEYSITDFTLSSEERKQLIQIGRDHAEHFLKKWSR